MNFGKMDVRTPASARQADFRGRWSAHFPDIYTLRVCGNLAFAKKITAERFVKAKAGRTWRSQSRNANAHPPNCGAIERRPYSCPQRQPVGPFPVELMRGTAEELVVALFPAKRVFFDHRCLEEDYWLKVSNSRSAYRTSYTDKFSYQCVSAGIASGQLMNPLFALNE